MTDPCDRRKDLEAILQSPSYRVAYDDIEFLGSPRMRAAGWSWSFSSRS